MLAQNFHWNVTGMAFLRLHEFFQQIYEDHFQTQDDLAERIKALVDALLAALASGQVAAAGLDGFKVEPGGNPALATHDNIFMLAHIGSATRQNCDAMGFRSLDNLDAFFAGKTPGDLL